MVFDIDLANSQQNICALADSHTIRLRKGWSGYKKKNYQEIP